MRLSYRRGAAFVSKKAVKYFEHKSPEEIECIAVIRHAAIGDFVVMRPFLIELKKFFPNAKVTLNVTRSAMYGIPEDLIDDIHIMDKENPSNPTRKTNLWYRIKQARTLKKQDVIFDLTDSSLTLLLILFAKSDIKIGYSYRAFRRFFYDISTLRSDFVLETQSMLHQLNILGANTKHYPLEYQVSSKKRNEKNPYIIYFAGASSEFKCWGETNFIELIGFMKNKYLNYNHIILQGIKDNEAFDDIYEPFLKDINVAQQKALPLDEIYDYLAEASLVVVGDTGIRNMAIAANTPTLGIMYMMGISPLRYLPKIKEHEVVFNTDFTKPSFELVKEGMINIMDNLYEK